MVVDSATQSQKEEVSACFAIKMMSWILSDFQSSWIPQLEALFEDVRTIAPGNAYEVIG